MNSVLAALGLTRNPFPPTPDAESYFYTPDLEAEIAELQHCILSRKGFVLVTGEVGLGKSTLVRRLLAGLEQQQVHSALVLNTFLQDQALQDAILRDFGLPAGQGLGEGLDALNQFLLQRHRDGVTCLLVIDDAQNLTPSSLELVRLLCNLETAQEKLLQILLVGQPELESTLAQPGLRQLKSRIIKHTRLKGLTLDELGRYFDFRVNAAGSSGRLTLSPGAARLLHERSAGNLRQLHLVLDRCLYGLVSAHSRTVDESIMRKAIADVPELGSVPEAATPAAVRRFQPWRAAALGAGLGLASMAAWGAWHWLQQDAQRRPPTAVAALSVPPAPVQATVTAPSVQAPASEAASAALVGSAVGTELSARQSCVQALSERHSIPVAAVQVRSLPEALRGQVQPGAGLCIFDEAGSVQVAWADLGRSAQIEAAERIVKSAQLQLQAKGWSELPADGLLGPMTRQALARFQRQYGLAPTGQLDEWTLYLLEVAHAAAR
ncbi:MAG: ExeA family protein [Burkholderiaceae bacterium]